MRWQIYARHSKRSDRELVKIDCAALPKDLLEADYLVMNAALLQAQPKQRLADSKLPINQHCCLMKGSLPIDAQANLLRVSNNGNLSGFGGRQTFKINVRI
jgi:DNA-binding NtrC family response regulator